MKKLTTAILAASTVATAGILAMPTQGAQAAPVAPQCKSVWLIPHQDDEVLTFGGAIRNHVNAQGASTVCVALATTGASSGVRTNLTKGIGYEVLQNGVKKRVTHTGLANEYQFATARDRELVAALTALGVPKANIFISNTNVGTPALPGYTRPSDSLNKNTYTSVGRIPSNHYIRTFVDKAVAAFGTGVNYKTFSSKSGSGDHQALGLVLAAKSGLNSASHRYYVEPYRLSSVSGYSTEKPADPAVVKAAGRQYGYYNPAQYRYAIGTASVPSTFGGEFLAINGATKLTAPNVSLLDGVGASYRMSR